MSRADTWMPLYIGDYLADTMSLEAREHGAYLLLIMHYWRNGPLPDDDRALAGIARVDRKTWTGDTGPIVRGFFHANDGRLHHKRIDTEREAAQQIADKKRSAANARWGKDKPQKASGSGPDGQQKECIRDAYASPDASPVETVCTSPYAGALPSPSPSKKEPVATLPTPAEPSPDPIDARSLLWRQGVPIVRRLTGKPDGACRTLMGKWLGSMRDDCPAMLSVLQNALSADPADPVAWITAAVSNRGVGRSTAGKTSNHDWMHAEIFDRTEMPI